MTTVKNVLLKDAAGNYLIPYPSNAFDSRITTLENGTEKLSNKNIPNGYVGLGSDGMISKNFYDNVNVGFKTFMTSNAENPPSASWKAKGQIVSNSQFPTFYSEMLEKYNNGTVSTVDYSSYAKASECFLTDWISDDITGELIDTNKYRFTTDLFTVTIEYNSTHSTALGILKRFLGNWTATSGKYSGYTTYSGTLNIELILNSPYINYFNITKFSRFIENGYSNSAMTERYSLTCKIDITQNGTNWTTAYNSGPGWNVTVNQPFKGIRVSITSGGIEFGNYTWDEHTVQSPCYSNRYHYKPATMAVAPCSGYVPTEFNNKLRTNGNFFISKNLDYTGEKGTTGVIIPSSGIMNSNWILNGYYDFSNILNTIYRINTSNSAVKLPLTADYNYICVENSNLNLLEFYQDVITNYQKRDNSNNLKPYVVSHTQSSRYACRIWSNNFCEQWGVVTSTGKSGTLTLPQAYSSSTSWAMAYCEGFTTGTSSDTEGFDFTIGFSNATTNTVRYTCANGRTFSWFAAGWIA